MFRHRFGESSNNHTRGGGVAFFHVVAMGKKQRENNYLLVKIYKMK